MANVCPDRAVIVEGVYEERERWATVERLRVWVCICQEYGGGRWRRWANMGIDVRQQHGRKA